MNVLSFLKEQRELGLALSEAEAAALAVELGGIGGFEVYPRSMAAAHNALFFLGRRGTDKWLGVLSRGDNPALAGFAGETRDVTVDGETLVRRVCPTDHANAVALRAALPYTAPQVLGLRKSAGCGDRLGLATPGHIRAVRRCAGIAPIFAQQSIREMTRTQRTADQVMDDVSWGVFQEGWREGFGSDADHLKTADDVDVCVDAGFTLYTVDPGDHVDNEAHTASRDVLVDKVHVLPWDVLEDTPQALNERYLGRTFDLGEGFGLAFSEEILLRAAAKYGRAIAHTVQMYRHLVSRMGDKPSSTLRQIYPEQSRRAQGSGQGFELEVSVDETETPTSPHEHFFVANELKRLGVQWVSLAPRYIGRFEKGVDYIGDLARFEAEFVKHVAIARHLGPYKLSLHSGSDKFSIYPIIARHAGDLVHLKTAGTSYLEALRAIASIDPPLFRQILAFAHERYGEDKATYHMSADPARVPAPDQLADSELAGVLDLFDGRQVLHVTFGSALDRFGQRLKEMLAQHEEVYYAALETHFRRHLMPFV
ncbi:MAG: tagaturonate epimerase family protein [Anaerolineae bacterium]